MNMVLDMASERSRTERASVVHGVAQLQLRLDALRLKLAKEAEPNKCDTCGYEMGRCLQCDVKLTSAHDPRCYVCVPDMYPRVVVHESQHVDTAYYFKDCCRECGAATCGLKRSL
jgi:hypothetical protein